MANKFKKGDEVFVIGSWDDKGTFFYRHMIVDSCGKQRMTLHYVSDGQMMKHAIYSNRYNTVYLVSEVKDVEALARELAAEYIKNEIQFNKEHRLTNPAYNQPYVIERIQELEAAEPKAIPYVK